MKIFLLAVVILAIALAGLAIRILLVKGGRFNKTCSSSFSADGKKNDCVCSGTSKDDESQCKYYAEHHPEKSSGGC